jgi:subtilase family serine protease
MLPAPSSHNAVSFRPVFLSTVFLLLLLPCMPLAQGESADLVRVPVDPGTRVLLKGHHPIWANSKNDVGAVRADLPIERVTIVLNRSPQKQQAFEQFLRDQQNPASPDYHHWLTPAQIGQRFGVSAHDIAAVTGWLKSQGLIVDAISSSRQRITFSGAASAVATAFATEMHYFTVNGEKRISINADPRIPSALAGVINSISGLYTVKLHPQHRPETVHTTSHNIAWGAGVYSKPDLTLSNGSHVIAPADFATIYNQNGVTGGINGAGQTIAVVGRSRVCPADITNFASRAAVTANVPNVIVPPLGVDPGPANCGSSGASGDQSEATLDVTRSGSIAQGATLDLVVSADNASVDGIKVAATFVVDTPPTPAPKIMSISFGLCEQQAGSSEVQSWENLFQQAAAEGISVFVSSDDSAAAGCDTAFKPPPPTQFLNINAICSSGYATCVGGTEFADSANPGQYWSSSNGNGLESALSYIPEGAWNEPMNGSKFQVAGTGGGVSQFIATPTWQVGTGVPTARAGRYTPDVAFSASAHDGYFGCLAASGGSCVVVNGSFSFVEFSGTSASAPDMAGIAALVNQQQGAAQGLLNPNLYNLAGTPSNGVFNDVTVASSGVTNCALTTPSMCNNSTAGTTGLTGGLSGYLVTPGYDEATGLGSINVAKLLACWSQSGVATTTVLTVTPTSPVSAGTSVTLTATVTSPSLCSAPTGSVTFADAVLGILGTSSLSLGKGIFTSRTLAAASYLITATYSPTGGFLGSASSPVPYNVQDFKVTANPTTATVSAPGQSATTTLTITPINGFSQTLSYSCNQTTLPSGASCSFAAASATSETLTISTTAPSARLDKAPWGRGRGLFYALLLPGFLGLAVSVGSRKRTRRGIRLLSLIAAVALSTLWMPACGGGSSTPGNPGTPIGTSSVTVTATTGGTTPLTHTAIITLTVQ